MNAPTSPPQPKAGSLRLDVALQLLQQSGLALPDTRQSDPAGWLQAVLDGLCELSSRDALTGLANRRQFELAMAREIDRVARAGEPALVLMIDIDHFKRLNDTYGHPFGDLCLQRRHAFGATQRRVPVVNLGFVHDHTILGEACKTPTTAQFGLLVVRTLRTSTS